MSNDIRPQIESANAQFVTAFKRGDATAMANLYTAAAQLLPANSDFVRGTAAIRTFWQSVIDMGLKGASLETIELEAHGDTVSKLGDTDFSLPAMPLLTRASTSSCGRTTTVSGSCIVISGRQANRLRHREE